MRLFSKLQIKTKEDFFEFVKQFFKFGIVGLSNTFISLGIYYFLVYFEVNYIIANTIAFIISVLNAYYWNNKYVFERKEKGHAKSIIKVFMSYGSTFLLGTVLLFLMVNFMGISEWIAPLINLIVTIPLNFLLNKFWAFK